jgi:hypothetical protein
MTIRDAKNQRIQVPIRFEIYSTESNWVTIYSAGSVRGNFGSIKVIHANGQPNLYVPNVSQPPGPDKNLTPSQLMVPFAPGSDFWIADLGLEFFHWPEQHLIKKEMKRSRSCRVLESINPHPVPGGYSRVKSWIDAESDGIVYAEAYDASGKQLKEFIPKHFEKVNGQWQLKEMEIDNNQTDSSTRVDFDLSH